MKLIRVPFVFGKSSVGDFIKLHDKINNSNLKFTDINKLYFFHQKDGI